MLTWQDLEQKFHELEPPLRFARLDAQWGAAGEHWRVAGAPGPLETRRFEAVAALAGGKLRDSLIRTVSGPPELRAEGDPLICWYRGLSQLGGHLKHDFMATQLDDQGRPAGNIFTGTIDRPAEASAVFCLELATRLPEHEVTSGETVASVAPSRLRVFWDKYGSQVLIGVIVTVVGGLILALFV